MIARRLRPTIRGEETSTMKTYLALVLVFLFCVTAGPGRVKAQEASDSSVGRELGTSPNPPDANDPPDWLFPVAKLDQSLPSWLHIGGQYRNRFEAPSGIGYTAACSVPDRYPAPGPTARC
jgi:hypothetical protein